MKKLVLLSLLLFPFLSHSSNWQRRVLTSTNNVNIEVMYQMYDYVRYSQRRGVYHIHIYVNGFKLDKDKAQVRAVLINYMQDKPVCGRPVEGHKEVTIVDLKPFGDHIYGEYVVSPESGTRLILDLERMSYCRHQVSIKQELAIVVDGEWLTDPISSSSNFILNF